MAKKAAQKKINVAGKLKHLLVARRKLLQKVLLGLGIAALLFFVKSYFVAAIVNNRPVFRASVTRELEKQAGKQVLGNLIDKSLISQEAVSQKIKITDADIDTEIARIEKMLKEQNTTLEDALSAQGQTRESLIDQIKLQKTVERILEAKLNITDEELKKYFEENKGLFDKDAKFEAVKDEVRSQLVQQKLASEYQKWITELRAKAKILYFVKF